MRIKLNFTKNTDNVPNNLEVLTSYIHNCLGRNNQYHNNTSNYCISNMQGGTVINGGREISYLNGGYILVTSKDVKFIDAFIMGAEKNKEYGYGMSFINFDIINDTFYNGKNYFLATETGILLKDKNDTFVTIKDANFAEFLKDRLIKKLSLRHPNLNLSNVKVSVNGYKSKNVYLHKIKNISSTCNIVVECDKKVAEAIYNMGIGISTGSGFGTLKVSKKGMLV